MPRIVRRHWRGILAACGLAALLSASLLAGDTLGPPDGIGTADYVTEDELVEWGYRQAGQLVLKYWLPVVGFMILWSWRIFTWQTNTAAAIAENAENVAANRTSIENLATSNTEAIKEAREIAAREAARTRRTLKVIGEALVASLDNEDERRRLMRKVMEID